MAPSHVHPSALHPEPASHEETSSGSSSSGEEQFSNSHLGIGRRLVAKRSLGMVLVATVVAAAFLVSVGTGGVVARVARSHAEGEVTGFSSKDSKHSKADPMDEIHDLEADADAPTPAPTGAPTPVPSPKVNP